MRTRDVYCLVIRLGGVACFALAFFDLTHVISVAQQIITSGSAVSYRNILTLEKSDMMWKGK